MVPPKLDSLLLEEEVLGLAIVMKVGAQDDVMGLLLFKEVEQGQANKATILEAGALRIDCIKYYYHSLYNNTGKCIVVIIF